GAGAGRRCQRLRRAAARGPAVPARGLRPPARPFRGGRRGGAGRAAHAPPPPSYLRSDAVAAGLARHDRRPPRGGPAAPPRPPRGARNIVGAAGRNPGRALGRRVGPRGRGTPRGEAAARRGDRTSDEPAPGVDADQAAGAVSGGGERPFRPLGGRVESGDPPGGPYAARPAGHGWM
ncbi:MAG: hypothetical protein AVDCRST_MAG27-288, partial [uncultured Craurococcus sp.]